MKQYRFIKNIIICGFLTAASCGTFTQRSERPNESYEYLSPQTIVADPLGRTLYIVDATARRITVLDNETNTVTGTIGLRQNPGGLAIAPDGSYLYATSGSSDGIIEIVDLVRNRVVKSIPAGHTPCAPVVSPDGKTLYVCNRFDNNISIIDLARKKEVGRVPMLREPISAALTPDGKYLFVANLLPSGRTLSDYVSKDGIMMIGSYRSQRTYGGGKMDYAATGVVLVLNTETRRLAELIKICDGATGLRGLCVSPDGRYVYVTHILANYTVPTEKIERGGINANALSIIDVPGLKLITTVLLDDIDRGAANPWDVECSPDGKYLCVTHAGTHEISIIDRAALHRKREIAARAAPANEAFSPADAQLDPIFLNGVRRRIPLAGIGPRDMAIIGSRIYAAEYFSDSVGIIEMETGNTPIPRSIPLDRGKSLTEKRKGEILFNDARICFQRWQSCASCHPEGRMDGLTWDLLNDGSGNPKKTKSLLYSHQTPPVMITGVRADAETAVRAGIKYIQFTVQPESTAAAIDTYLRSLQPVPSPRLQKGKLSKSAQRGAEVFQKAGCSTCHIPPLYTDRKKYDVGIGIGTDTNRAFDTPTLREVWRTSPYLYDGRAAMMHEVIYNYNKNNRHGLITKLDVREWIDLIQFVLSL